MYIMSDILTVGINIRRQYSKALHREEVPARSQEDLLALSPGVFLSFALSLSVIYLRLPRG